MTKVKECQQDNEQLEVENVT